MIRAHRSQKGAADLDGKMIDAPMIKQVGFVLSLRVSGVFIGSFYLQARKIIEIAKSAGLKTPQLE